MRTLQILKWIRIKEILHNNYVMFLNRDKAPSFLFDAGIEAVLR
jgi:hypothetical protein